MDMAERSPQSARWIALVWLLVGVGMLAASFVSKSPSQQYVKMLAEKVILEKQNKPHDHLNPDAIEHFRPAWKSPLFLFGIGAIILAGVQWTLAQADARRVSTH